MKLLIAVALAANIVCSLTASAQDYPARDVQLVIPFPPGGGNDIYARILADGLSRKWGVSVVAENLPGAGGSIGMANVARSHPDGYRIALTSSTFATNAVAQTNLPFDAIKDLQPISLVAEGQLVLVAGKHVKAETVKELAALAKERTVFFGSTGPGSTAIFLCTLLTEEMGVKMEAVPYDGGAAALLDVVGGRLDLFLGTVTAMTPAITNGSVKPLVVLGAKRSATLANVPTIAEAGYPGAESSFWYGAFGPAGMPEAVVTKINADISAVMADPAVGAILTAQGATPNAMGAPEFSQFVREQVTLLKDIAKRGNLVAN